MSNVLANTLFTSTAPFNLPTPSPGQYDADLPKSITGFSSARARRIVPESLPTIGDDSPGPLYTPNESLERRKGRSAVLRLEERRELPQDKESERRTVEPGPGEYSPRPPKCRVISVPQEARVLSFPDAHRDSPGPVAYCPSMGRRSERHAHTMGKSSVSRSAWLNTQSNDSAPDLPPEFLARLLKHGTAVPAGHANKRDLFYDATKPVDFVIPGTNKGFHFGQSSRKFELEAQFRNYISPGPADYERPIVQRPPKWHTSAPKAHTLDPLQPLTPNRTLARTLPNRRPLLK
eukprot:GGOE01002169.1.p1 GENE.GGOE01002169.1~~GGOE01002169.1.p1  ORF type:complete len:291 (-),score=7.94 GGOE01002169.1:250-1122(-)